MKTRLWLINKVTYRREAISILFPRHTCVFSFYNPTRSTVQLTSL